MNVLSRAHGSPFRGFYSLSFVPVPLGGVCTRQRFIVRTSNAICVCERKTFTLCTHVIYKQTYTHTGPGFQGAHRAQDEVQIKENDSENENEFSFRLFNTNIFLVGFFFFFFFSSLFFIIIILQKWAYAYFQFFLRFPAKWEFIRGVFARALRTRTCIPTMLSVAPRNLWAQRCDFGTIVPSSVKESVVHKSVWSRSKSNFTLTIFRLKNSFSSPSTVWCAERTTSPSSLSFSPKTLILS